jgi:hypothetical protein
MDFSFQGRHPPTQLAVMAAHIHNTTKIEQPWYLDSGANHHVTLERENLILQQPYHGNDSVTVGNGGGLQVANIGSSLFSTLKSNFYLHNILHCLLLICFPYKNFVVIIIVILFLPPLIFSSRICRPRKSSCKDRVKQIIIQSTSNSSNPIKSSPKLCFSLLLHFFIVLLAS